MSNRMDFLSSLRIVAAGMGRTMSHPRMVETVLSMVRRADDNEPIRVVYLGTASFDDLEAEERQVAGFRAHPACQVYALRVSERIAQQPSADEIRGLILSADVLQVSGGNTLYAMNRWKQLGIDRLIRQAAATGTVLCGGSAGAICWFQQGHSQSQNPAMQLHVDPNLTDEQRRNWKYMLVEGLGLLPLFCVPHHDVCQTNGVPREIDSNQMMMQQLPRQIMMGIGIDEEAALVVQDGSVRVVTVKEGATCCLKYCRGGFGNQAEVVIRRLDEANGCLPLQKMLLLSRPAPISRSATEHHASDTAHETTHHRRRVTSVWGDTNQSDATHRRCASWMEKAQSLSSLPEDPAVRA